MANLNSPSVSVVFTELGITAINRGDKGVVAVILRDTASVDPVALTQAIQIPSTLGADNQAYLQRAFLGYVNPPKKVIAYTTDAEDANLTQALAYMATQDFDYLWAPRTVPAARRRPLPPGWTASGPTTARNTRRCCPIRPATSTPSSTSPPPA